MKNNVMMPTEVTEEVLKKQFSQVVEVECDICNGTGVDPFNDDCDLCNGMGKVMVTCVISKETIKEIYATSVELMGQEIVQGIVAGEAFIPNKKKGRGRPKKGK